jgi:NADPH2:quinone reductase
MLAITADATREERLVLEQMAAPIPRHDEAVVQVHAISLNYGEVARALALSNVKRPGWDLAGVVTEAAADGSGPRVGTRIVGLVHAGAWAEWACVPTSALASLPDTVSFAAAATLPIAGLTAYYALARGGLLVGKSVLVTGASGGVGHFANQLGVLAGARVVGAVRRRSHVDAVAAVGAVPVIITENDPTAASTHGPYDLVLEAIGGRSLNASLNMLAHDGACVFYGSASGGQTSGGADVSISIGALYGKGRVRLEALSVFDECISETAAVGLQRLVALLGTGRLSPHIGLQASWKEIGRIARQFAERQFAGKVVLELIPSPRSTH